MPNQDEMRFLSWSIGSRHETQEQALRLLKLMEQHSKAASKHKIRMRVLVAVSFALWRAAFLADRKGLVDVTFSASKAFLSKMLTDNAITFNVDWTQRDWSFRFYADAARQNLKRLEAHWPNFKVRVRAKVRSNGIVCNSLSRLQSIA